MGIMTDEEADALDELWTRTTPEIDTSKPGFLTRKGFTMVSLDPVTAAYLQAKSAITHHSPSEISANWPERNCPQALRHNAEGSMANVEQVHYYVMCVGEFAKAKNMNAKDAFNYLYAYKGIEFLCEFYGVEHTLSLENAGGASFDPLSWLQYGD